MSTIQTNTPELIPIRAWVEEHGLDIVRVYDLLRNSEVSGAQKVGRLWFIDRCTDPSIISDLIRSRPRAIRPMSAAHKEAISAGMAKRSGVRQLKLRRKKELTPEQERAGRARDMNMSVDEYDAMMVRVQQRFERSYGRFHVFPDVKSKGTDVDSDDQDVEPSLEDLQAVPEAST